MIDLQAYMDGMSAQWQRERAQSQITLRKMIAELKALPPELKISGLARPHSYRGYYSDLAFEPASVQVTAVDLLKLCESAMGQVFEGYKGGDFVMGALTPVWISAYGTTGLKLIAINPDGSLETAEDD